MNVISNRSKKKEEKKLFPVKMGALEDLVR
jgi:hypothetical protein